MTLGEILLWQELSGKKVMGYDFDRQRPIDSYIVDFYCKELQLAIENDGESHGYYDVIENDKKRQRRLETLGVNFLRFDDDDVKTDIGNVVEDIELWIKQHRPTANPSQEGT